MTDTTEDAFAGAGKPISPDTAAITVPLDLFKRLVEMADDEAATTQCAQDLECVMAARREIEQVEALLASPLE